MNRARATIDARKYFVASGSMSARPRQPSSGATSLRPISSSSTCGGGSTCTCIARHKATRSALLSGPMLNMRIPLQFSSDRCSDHPTSGDRMESAFLVQVCSPYVKQIVQATFSPPLRGGLDARSIRCREASLTRADGVVINYEQIMLELDHHSVRSTKEASQYFVNVAATPPRRGGDSSLS